ncbi:MAG: hypothetical protein RMM31_01000 [Anaerolineae bacterium]|nr:hypothetical protein [Thermoflexales bacterium]MDW8394802.1 hypothetical protein [Anaerolineae bacterium]
MHPNNADSRARFAVVLRVKAVLASAFLILVLLTLRHPVSVAFGVIDLVLLPFFAWLAQRNLRAATYGLIAQTALFLLPRQFVQGYVNGVNWPIYIVLPAVAGFVLAERRAVLLSAGLTAAIALPSMVAAALTLPPAMTRADALTLLVFVLGLTLALGLVLSYRSPDAAR